MTSVTEIIVAGEQKVAAPGFPKKERVSCHWFTAPTKQPISSNATTPLFATTALFLLLSVWYSLSWLPARFSRQHRSEVESRASLPPSGPNRPDALFIAERSQGPSHGKLRAQSDYLPRQRSSLPSRPCRGPPQLRHTNSRLGVGHGEASTRTTRYFALQLGHWNVVDCGSDMGQGLPSKFRSEVSVCRGRSHPPLTHSPNAHLSDPVQSCQKGVRKRPAVLTEPAC